MAHGDSPRSDDEVADYIAGLGLDGVIDVHVHFMPDSVQEKVWRHFDRLTDPPWPITYRMSEDARLSALAGLGVRHHTALAYAHRPGMAAWLNDHTLALAESRPAVIPTFTLYPEPGVDEYVHAALERGGAVVKIHLQVGRFHTTDPALDGAWAVLADRGVPVVLHAGAVNDGSGGEEYCGVDKVSRLLERFPDLVLVIAHMGAPDYVDFLALAESSPTVLLDTTMAFADPRYLGPYPRELLDRVAALGTRVLWGSDFPTVPYTYAEELSSLVALGLGDDWLRGVLWDNAARLLGLAAT